MLKITRLYLNNPLRNYNYLIVDTLNQTAVSVDPLDKNLILETLKKENLKLEAVILTHEHGDHYRDAKPLAELTNTQIYAHYSNQNDLPKMDIALKDNDVLTFSDILTFKVIETPGHIKGHICFYIQTDEIPRLITGDTLFNAGVGNCRHHSASVEQLYDSIKKIKQLPKETLIYPSHDYIQTNLKFALTQEKDNQDAQNLLEKVNKQTSETREITNLETEFLINPFLRLNDLKQDNETKIDTFRRLRALRDQF